MYSLSHLPSQDPHHCLVQTRTSLSSTLAVIPIDWQTSLLNLGEFKPNFILIFAIWIWLAVLFLHTVQSVIILCPCLVVAYTQDTLHFLALHMFLWLFYGCTLTLQTCVFLALFLKSLGGWAFPLGAEVKGLYIKVAFNNMIYVTWNKYQLKSEENVWRCFFFAVGWEDDLAETSGTWSD